MASGRSGDTTSFGNPFSSSTPPGLNNIVHFEGFDSKEEEQQQRYTPQQTAPNSRPQVGRFTTFGSEEERITNFAGEPLRPLYISDNPNIPGARPPFEDGRSKMTPNFQPGVFGDLLDLNRVNPDKGPDQRYYQHHQQQPPPFTPSQHQQLRLTGHRDLPVGFVGENLMNNVEFQRYLGFEYKSYTKYVLVIALHAFITSFFMLWSITSTSLPDELIATKFFHIIAPFACLHYWILYNYPVHFYAVRLKEVETSPAFSIDQKKKKPPPKNVPNPISLDEIKARLYNGTALRMFLFFVPFAIDLIFFCVKLIPLAAVCFDPSAPSGGVQLPVECGGWEGNTDNMTLFVVTFVVDLIQIIVGLTVVIMTYFTQPKLKKDKNS